MAQEQFETVTTFGAGNRKLKITDKIVMCLSLGGSTNYLYAAEVGSVSDTLTNPGPDEVAIVGKGSANDFDELYVLHAGDYFAYAAGKDRTNLSNLEWIFADEA